MAAPRRRVRLEVKTWLRIGVLAVLALWAGFWIAANITINTSRVHEGIARRVAALIGAPLKIDTIRVGPLGGIHLKGLRIDVTPPGGQREEGDDPKGGVEGLTALPFPLFSGKGLRIQVSWLSLFGRSIRIKEIILEEPEFSVLRDADGQFLLPERPADERPEGSETPEGEAVPGAPGVEAPLVAAPFPDAADLPARPPEPPLPSPANLAPEGAAGSGSGPAPGSAGSPPPLPPPGSAAAEITESAQNAAAAGTLQPEPATGKAAQRKDRPLVIRFGSRDYRLGDLVMRRGLFRLVSLEGSRTLVEVQDMEMRMAVRGDPLNSGTFQAGRVTLVDTIALSDLRSNLDMSGFNLNFSEISADAYGGKFEGALSVQPFQAGLPFRAAMLCHEIEMAPLGRDIRPDLDFTSGVLEGMVQVLGYARYPSSYLARGRFDAAGASIRGSQWIHRTPVGGKTEALEDIGIDEMKVIFAMAQGQVQVQDMRFASDDISIVGRGWLNIQGQLSLASRVYVSDRAHFAIQQMETVLPESLRFGFQPFEASGRFFRDYTLRGSAFDPRIDLFAGGVEVRAADLKTFFSEAMQGRNPVAEPAKRKMGDEPGTARRE